MCNLRFPMGLLFAALVWTSAANAQAISDAVDRSNKTDRLTWTMTCDDKSRLCGIHYVLHSSIFGPIVAVANHGDDSEPRVQLIIGRSHYAMRGATIRLQKGSRLYVVFTCDKYQCIATWTPDAKEFTNLLAHDALLVDTLISAAESVTIRITLDGFVAAYTELQKLLPKTVATTN